MYDLTSIDRLRRPGDKRLTTAQINAMLSRPDGERTVATVVHEATHQMAFNCGLHTRYADIPVWVSEGIAMYFETPDLKSTSGWTTIGAVNRTRLAGFKSYLADRPADSLKSLVVSDARFRDARQATNAYGEAWGLVHHLMLGQRNQKQFVERQAGRAPARVRGGVWGLGQGRRRRGAHGPAAAIGPEIRPEIPVGQAVPFCRFRC
jgi:hypothetical protein